MSFVLLNYTTLFSSIFLSPNVVYFDYRKNPPGLIMLGEFFHRSKTSGKTVYLSRHTVLDISPWCIQVVTFFDQWKK